MFRFATGTGQHIQEWTARKFDRHRLLSCMALCGQALALLTLLSPLLERLRRLRAGPGLPRHSAHIPPSTLLLPSDFMRLHMRLEGPAASAEHPNPGPAPELPVMPASTLLVIARRRIRAAFMHARAGEAGSRPLGRR